MTTAPEGIVARRGRDILPVGWMWLALLCGCSSEGSIHPLAPGGGAGGSAGSGGLAGSGGTGGEGGSPDVGAPLWAEPIRGPLSAHAMKVQIDGEGELAFAGYFEGEAEFAGQPLVSAGEFDLLIAKLTRTGELRWAHTLGSPEREREACAAVAPDGGVVLSGDFEGTLTIDGSTELTSQGLADLLLVRYDPDGALLWAKALGGPGMDMAPVVAFDSAGDLFVAAMFEGTVDFGGGPLTAVSSRDVVVAKFDGPSGAHLWSKSAGGGADEAPHGIAVSPDGDVAVTGWFGNSIDFGTGPLTPGGGFVAVLSGQDGAGIWARALSNGTNVGGCGLGFDAAGDLLVTGWFQGELDFGGGPLTAVDHSDAFVAHYEGTAGTHRWSHGYGGQGTDSSCAAAATANGDWVVGGFFQQTIDFGGGPIQTVAFPPNGFLARLAGLDGAHRWSHRFGGTAGDYVHSVAVHPNGDVVMAANFQDQVDLFGLPLASAGFIDGLVANLPATVLDSTP